MSTCLMVKRTFEENGDAYGETHGYIVQFDDILATAAQARVASDGVDSTPAEGSLLAGTLWRAKVNAKKRPDEPTFFDVEVKYELPSLTNETKPEGTGVKWNIKISSKAAPYERPAYVDFNGNPIENKAGYPFKEQPVYNDYDSIWTFGFNTDNGQIIDDIEAIIGRANTDEITFTYKGITKTFAAYTLRLVDYSWDYDHNYAGTGLDEAFVISLTMARRQDFWWDLELANEGFYDIDDIEFRDIHGNIKGEPTLLGTDGYELAPSAEAVPLKFAVKTSITFAPLFVGL